MPLYRAGYEGSMAPWMKGEPSDLSRYLVISTLRKHHIGDSSPGVILQEGELVTGKQLKNRIYGAIACFSPDLTGVFVNVYLKLLQLDDLKCMGIDIDSAYSKNDNKRYRVSININKESFGRRPEMLDETLTLLKEMPSSVIVAKLYPRYAELYKENHSYWSAHYFYCKAIVEGIL